MRQYLFVEGLPFKATTADVTPALRKLLAPIVDVSWVHKRPGDGFGHVSFVVPDESVDEARRRLLKLDRTPFINGRYLGVPEHKQRWGQAPGTRATKGNEEKGPEHLISPNVVSRQVCVRHLPVTAADDRDVLLSILDTEAPGASADLQNVKVVRRTAQGCAVFLTFKTAAVVAPVASALDGARVMGNRLQAAPACAPGMVGLNVSDAEVAAAKAAKDAKNAKDAKKGDDEATAIDATGLGPYGGAPTVAVGPDGKPLKKEGVKIATSARERREAAKSQKAAAAELAEEKGEEEDDFGMGDDDEFNSDDDDLGDDDFGAREDGFDADEGAPGKGGKGGLKINAGANGKGKKRGDAEEDLEAMDLDDSNPYGGTGFGDGGVSEDDSDFGAEAMEKHKKSRRDDDVASIELESLGGGSEDDEMAEDEVRTMMKEGDAARKRLVDRGIAIREDPAAKRRPTGDTTEAALVAVSAALEARTRGVVLGGLPPSASVKCVQAAVKAAGLGGVSNLKIVRHPLTGAPTGVATFETDTPESAARIVGAAARGDVNVRGVTLTAEALPGVAPLRRGPPGKSAGRGAGPAGRGASAGRGKGPAGKENNGAKPARVGRSDAPKGSSGPARPGRSTGPAAAGDKRPRSKSAAPGGGTKRPRSASAAGPAAAGASGRGGGRGPKRVRRSV